MKTRLLVLTLSLVSAAAFAQPKPPQPPQPPERPMGPGPRHMMMSGPPGIPPHLAQKLGISEDTMKKVRNMTFDANEQLIGLEAEAKKKQLALHRVMAEDRVDEKVVMARLDEVARAELGVRKNRISLMLRIRALLGPDTWKKLEAEMPPFGAGHMMMGPGGPGSMRKEVRIMRGPMGDDMDIQVHEE